LNDYVRHREVDLTVVDSKRKLEFGAIWTLLCCSRAHRALPITYLEDVIEPAIRNRQCAIFQNSQNEVVGFAVWAKISEETYARLVKTGNIVLHHSEWNEGNIYWLVDFIALSGYAKSLLTIDSLALIDSPDEILYTRRREKSLSIRSIDSQGMRKIIEYFARAR
jgi:hemolysin-activating ACP:hemolysin acyltransferase